MDVPYWNSFYAKKERQDGVGEAFDWFEADEDVVFAELRTREPPYRRVLHLGCGTSAWCDRLEPGPGMRGGYGSGLPGADVVHLDASPVAVAALAARLPRAQAEGRLVLADARDLGGCHFLESESFDLVLDKGAIDCFLAAGAVDCAARVVAEVGRLLVPGGDYVMVTGEAPELRGPSFEAAAQRAMAMHEHRGWGSLRARNVSLENTQYEAFLYTATKDPKPMNWEAMTRNQKRNWRRFKRPSARDPPSPAQ